MKAVVYEEYAPDDDYKKILKVKDIDDPKPKSNEIVLKLKAAALNYNDLWGMRGEPIAIPLPHISGSDAAGDVVAVGEDIKNFKVGDRVVSHSNLACRTCAMCTSGREFDCVKRQVWGFQTGPLWGAYAELVHLPETNVSKIPEGVSYDDAAAASMTILTSWHMLVGRAKITPGQTVLIMGGGSGVGSFGIQIAKLYNCDVIATASPNKLDKCKELGADYFDVQGLTEEQIGRLNLEFLDKVAARGDKIIISIPLGEVSPGGSLALEIEYLEKQKGYTHGDDGRSLLPPGSN